MASAPFIKDRQGERRLFTRRAAISFVVMTAMMLGLVGRSLYLQVANYQHYATLSQENRVKLVPIPPTRGLIYDRNGVVLAENRPTFQLVVTPEQVKDMAGTLQRLGELVALNDQDLERFEALRRRKRRFDEIPLRFHLSEEEVARVAVNRHQLPGVEVRADLTRAYPLGGHFAHAVGYVGRISERELDRIDPADYSGTTHIGKTGVERYYEDLLHGNVGVERVETNALGRVIRTLDRQPPTPGKDIYLTLDVRLQRAAEAALEGYRGAVVAMDPNNGDILAFVSQPNFDPNLFVNGIDVDTYRELQSDRGQPLFNRALRGQYPPGSTVKPFIGLAGLEHGATTPTAKTFCPGFYSLPGKDHRYRCWKKWGHGHVNLEEAIVQSCDVYFYDLSYNLGIDNMASFLAPFGFGRDTGVDLIGELSGILPSREWKRAAKGEGWYHGETLITSIGQGFFLSTPLQLASATATLAKRGLRVRPRLLRAIGDPASGELAEHPVQRPGEPIALKDERNWDRIIDAMHKVVQSSKGTARKIGDAPYTMAGKTGTAQVFSLGQEEEYDAEELAKELHDHALFIAFAPVEDPQIVVAVVAEHGGSGSGTAAPIARRVLDAYLLDGQAEGDAGDQ